MYVGRWSRMEPAMPTDLPCRHISTLRVAQCRGVRRIVHCLNMLLREQAPDNMSHADTSQHFVSLSVAAFAMRHSESAPWATSSCRGVRRMHLHSNAPACVRAPSSHLRLICAWLIATRTFNSAVNDMQSFFMLIFF